ncbi:hypothetical protein G6646_04505 [Polynucleobacter paneuropaeus]|nr:hypothetical protein [Polynucleobacter paneuropaeus]
MNNSLPNALQLKRVGLVAITLCATFSQPLNALKTGDSIGFAVALQGGAFSVARFSLQGALPAIQKAIDEAARKKMQPAPNQQMVPQNRPGFKDITL